MKTILETGTATPAVDYGIIILILFFLILLTLMFIFWQLEYKRRCRVENELLELMGVKI